MTRQFSHVKGLFIQTSTLSKEYHTYRSCITVCWRMRARAHTHTPGGQNSRWCHRLKQGRCV